MINYKNISKLLLVFPIVAIHLLAQQANAANANTKDFSDWCEMTKEGMAQQNLNDAGTGGTISCFYTDPKTGMPKKYTTGFTLDENGAILKPQHCICDLNDNGSVDKGEEVKKVHRNQQAKNISPFSIPSDTAPSIDPLVLSSLIQASQNLFATIEFNNWVAVTLNNMGNLEMVVDLRDVPLLDLDSTFALEGFVEMNLVYQDTMGSRSGINLSTLVQGEKNFLELNPSIFEPFGEFSEWQLGVTVYNPITEQQVQVFEDKPIPEPSAILGLLTFGGLGIWKKMTIKGFK